MSRNKSLLLTLLAVGIAGWPDFRPAAAAIVVFVGVTLGYEILKNLRSAADRAAWLDRQLPFTRTDIERETEAAQKLWSELESSGDYRERFGGRTLNETEVAEFTRLKNSHESRWKEQESQVKLLDLMSQANARVASGLELRSEARSRVLKGHHDERMREMIEDANRTKPS